MLYNEQILLNILMVELGLMDSSNFFTVKKIKNHT